MNYCALPPICPITLCLKSHQRFQSFSLAVSSEGSRHKEKKNPNQIILLLTSCLSVFIEDEVTGSAQITFNITKSAEFTVCNTTVVIPCFATNVETKLLTDLYVKWKFKGKDIFTYDGAQGQSSTPSSGFKSAKITPTELLHGIASLKMKKSDAELGNYTCEVTELTREGETVIELKYRVALKYASDPMKGKTILLFVAGLLLTIVVIVGAILFIPGEYSTKNASGLGLIVIPTVILILLQYFVLMTAFGMTSFAIAILILQVLGFVLAVVGLSLCIPECTPVQGPLLISGLGIIALAELLGLVSMKVVASSQGTIQPPRKAVEEPLNAFKESKGMMNDGKYTMYLQF
ncbi:leukocyte surface antigen CD47 isoform 7-T9 [Trichechus inunguis]|uniref:Leukocyte surface antigen CD47 n=1 Tax=Trichechus manatus latirostris TaxID=127582 RepID=A0A2Y9R2I4_TRIMA|nr:leukocyte surface antigen CD47 isoform X5 [Trichechus manatus latirostris]